MRVALAVLAVSLASRVAAADDTPTESYAWKLAIADGATTAVFIAGVVTIAATGATVGIGARF